MIETWLDFPFWLGVPATLIFWLATAAALWWFFQRSRLAPFWRGNLGVVAPYFSSVAILFSLSVGFMGADIWQRAEQAQQSVLQETSNLKLLSHLAEILEPTTQPLAERICTYAKAVVQQEWPTMLLDGKASPTAETALDNLMLALATPEFTARVDATLRREMLNAFNQVRTYRVNRIQLSSGHSHIGKWVLVIFLGFMTQIAIGLVQLDKPRAQAITLAVFSITAAVTLTLLASMDQPFTEPFAVLNTPIADLARCK
ncbi:MAG TPA: DUF4239 domain-containing protein [Candidatus Competibacter sp.]|nr:DUF4239 domain-containing protein [Candidatus Competibacter sp.]